MPSNTAPNDTFMTARQSPRWRISTGPVVPVSDDADIYIRLAAYLGRQP